MIAKRTVLSIAVVATLCSCATLQTPPVQTVVISRPSHIEQVYVNGKLEFAACTDCPSVTPQVADTRQTPSNLFSFVETASVPGMMGSAAAIQPAPRPDAAVATSVAPESAAKIEKTTVSALPSQVVGPGQAIPVSKHPGAAAGPGDVAAQFLQGGLYQTESIERAHMVPAVKPGEGGVVSPTVSSGASGTPKPGSAPVVPSAPGRVPPAVASPVGGDVTKPEFPRNGAVDGASSQSSSNEPEVDLGKSANTAVRDAEPSREGVVQVTHTRPANSEEFKAVVNFAFGKADLSSGSDQVLKQVVELSRNAAKVSVRGYTDSIGNKKINDALARIRAEIVRRMLVREGVSVPIEVSSEGLCCYVASNDTDGGRAANRRVEISVQQSAAQHATAGNTGYGKKEAGT
jgi:outer membrane protein OmpA-like peptidoglycan-associated protein